MITTIKSRFGNWGKAMKKIIILVLILVALVGYSYAKMGMDMGMGMGTGTGSGSPSGDALILEDGSGYLLLETGDYLLLE